MHMSWMSNSRDPDEMAYEPSHLDLCCLQKRIIIASGSERVNQGTKLTIASSKFATLKFSLLPGQTVGSASNTINYV